MRGHKYDIDPVRDPVTGHIDGAELRRRLKGWFAVLLAFTVLFGGFGFAAYKGYDAYRTFKFAHDFPGPGEGEVQIVIPPNSTATSIGKLLQDAGVVKEAKKFSEAAAARPDQYSKVQAGKYKLLKGLPAATALAMLVDPKNAIRNLMQLRDGLRLSQQIAVIADRSKVPADAITAYLGTTPPTTLGLPSYAPSNTSASSAEGFLFPDTYDIPDGAKADTMVRKAIAQYNAVATKIDLAGSSAALNFGKDNTANGNKAFAAVIVASIIEREVSRPEDKPKVARVIYNRLAQGMKLQMDSTVAYAINKTDSIWTTDADRAKPNPYNTYVVPGLPIGPICAPSESSLVAALHPEDGNWLYFQPVNLDTGETVFSPDQPTHDAAAAQLRTWCAQSPANQKKCA